MNSKVIRRAGMWLSCAVLMAGLGYSVAVLTAQPAYAGSICEADDCTLVNQTLAPQLCQQHGGVQSVDCVPGSDYFQVFCNDGYTPPTGNCTNW
jgi:hypothetical protein